MIKPSDNLLVCRSPVRWLARCIKTVSSQSWSLKNRLCLGQHRHSCQTLHTNTSRSLALWHSRSKGRLELGLQEALHSGSASMHPRQTVAYDGVCS